MFRTFYFRVLKWPSWGPRGTTHSARQSWTHLSMVRVVRMCLCVCVCACACVRVPRRVVADLLSAVVAAVRGHVGHCRGRWSMVRHYRVLTGTHRPVPSGLRGISHGVTLQYSQRTRMGRSRPAEYHTRVSERKRTPLRFSGRRAAVGSENGAHAVSRLLEGRLGSTGTTGVL
jgi:hypothetical protein